MLTIRPFHADDLENLYAISLATGHAGGDASHLYIDPKLLGHTYSAPYACLEPRLALVIEDRKGVAGFAVGVAETSTWEQRLEQAWWPSLRKRYPMPSEAEAPNWTHDQRRSFMIHRPTRTPPVVASRFPAHVHLNLLARIQGRGAGTELFKRWLAVASKDGDLATHVAINRANTGAMRFWDKMGFADLPVDVTHSRRTIWKGRLPDADLGNLGT